MPSKPSRPLHGQALSAKLDEILKAPIPSYGVSPLYHFSLLFSAGAIIILPLIYMALIGAVGYGVYYHATEHYSIFAELTGGRWGLYLKLVIYIAPLIMGAMLIGFMLKPFIAPPRDVELGPTLSQAEEPVVYNLVALLCEKLDAPMPNRIDVTADINASASFRRGWLSFLGSDMVLTIGMPLVSGLTIRQLAGVIAHELGHFRQGSAMRLNYIIRSINHWFARVVYQRDQWDYWLEVGEEDDGLTVVVFRASMSLLVGATRCVLWILMLAAQAISSFSSRQMEYDADQSLCAIAGSEGIEAFLIQLNVLEMSHHAAMRSRLDQLKDHQLYDDLPGYVGVQSKMLKDEALEKLTTKLLKERTGPFSSHPSIRSRVRHAKKMQYPGILNLDTPASTLFHGYAILCKVVTYAWYTEQIGSAVSQYQLVSTQPLIEKMQKSTTYYEGLSDYLHGAYDPTRPPRIQIGGLKKLEDPASAAKRLYQVNEQYLKNAKQYRKLLDQRESAESDVMQARSIVRIFQSGLQIDPEYLPSGMKSRVKALAAHHAADMRFHAIEAELEPYDKLVTERLKLAIQLLSVPAVAKKVPQAKDHMATVKNTAPGLSKLARNAELILEIKHDLQLLTFMKDIQKDIPRHSALDASIADTNNLVQKSIHKLQAKTVVIHGQKSPEIEIVHNSAFSDNHEPIIATSASDTQELDVTILTANQEFQSQALSQIIGVAQEIEAKLPQRN